MWTATRYAQCVLLWPGLLWAQASRPLPLTVIEPPHSWVVPFSEGNRNEGKLYFATLVHNTSRKVAEISATFQSYGSDGSAFESCSSLGPTDDVLPGGRALIVCNGLIVPITTSGKLRTTARYTMVPVVEPHVRGVSVVEVGLVASKTSEDSSAEGERFSAFARVKATGQRDVGVRILLRFLDGSDTQVATYESDNARIEPEVERRLMCSVVGPWLPAGVPRPVRVIAEVRRPTL